MRELVERTKGHSGADIKNLCTEACIMPIREAIRSEKSVKEVRVEQLRGTGFSDFMKALKTVKATVAEKDIQQYVEWNEIYGSFSIV